MWLGTVASVAKCAARPRRWARCGAHHCSTVATRAIYLEDTYQFSATAVVVANGQQSDSGSWGLLLDATPFHPQGGGQPADTGLIRNHQGVEWQVMAAQMVGSRVVHQGALEPPFVQGDVVECVIDEQGRRRAARVHSAGHLIDVAMTQCGCPLRPTKGFHFPAGAYVEYAGILTVDERRELLPRLQTALDALVQQAAPTSVFSVAASELGEHCAITVLPTNYQQDLDPDKQVRVVEIGGICCPCGGTHVGDTSQIGQVVLKSIKKKRDFKIYK